MNQVEENVMLGQIMSDYLEAKTKLILLETELKKTGSYLSDVGNSLSNSFFITEHFEKQLENFPTSESVLNLAKEYLTWRMKKEVSERRLKALGLEVK